MSWEQVIDIQDHSLFKVWKNVKNLSTDILDQSFEMEMLLPVITESDLSGISFDQIEVLTSEAITEEFDIEIRNVITTVLDQEESLKFLNLPSNVEIDVPSTLTDNKVTIENNVETNLEVSEDVIPSPFKKALVYPEDKTNLKKKKAKRKNSICYLTSNQWQEYYKRKRKTRTRKTRKKQNVPE